MRLRRASSAALLLAACAPARTSAPLRAQNAPDATPPAAPSTAPARTTPPPTWPAVPGEPRRGSWIVDGRAAASDVVLATELDPPVIVVGASEEPPVQQAAQFLARDLTALTGNEAFILHEPPATGSWVSMETRSEELAAEAYTIVVDAGHVSVVGGDARGTAYGVYELSERLGIDPLHWFTGYEPAPHVPLVVQRLRHSQSAPTVRYRGLFHDDIDILPEGRLIGGTVSFDWYARLFETALRLRMNLVAPWVRENRYADVPRLANEWGLLYTSHHYDAVLSDPYHLDKPQRFRPPLAPVPPLREVRGIDGPYDWIANRDGLLRFWEGGVRENQRFDCIWPLALRGTDDKRHAFPPGTSKANRVRAFNDAFREQRRLVDEALEPDRPRLFHLTLYAEMLELFTSGELEIPDNVIVVWPDDDDGRMVQLPTAEQRGRWKHGAYYHLAYFGNELTKQTHQVVPPARIGAELGRILDADATELWLVNVSELREVVLGTRMIADAAWLPNETVTASDYSSRYLEWWAREYFGERAAPAVVAAYEVYFDLSSDTPTHSLAARTAMAALKALRRGIGARDGVSETTRQTLADRSDGHAELAGLITRARERIQAPAARRFFFENLELAAAIDRLATLATLDLLRASRSSTTIEAVAHAEHAVVPLRQLQALFRQAERPPFEDWYRPTWIAERNVDVLLPLRELEAWLEQHAGAPELASADTPRPISL